MKYFHFMVKAALALTVGSSGWALASEATPDTAPVRAAAVAEDSTVAQMTPVVIEVTAAVSGFGVPLARDQLNVYRGGFDLDKNDMRLSGVVTNNSAVNVMTGSNYIADGAFSNASGLPMVIQNSGSNVLIQNATIVNVQFQ